MAVATVDHDWWRRRRHFKEATKKMSIANLFCSLLFLSLSRRLSSSVFQQEFDSDDASPLSCSDVESFQGKIVYNPDGSAYIIDSENESLSNISSTDNCTTGKYPNDLVCVRASHPSLVRVSHYTICSILFFLCVCRVNSDGVAFWHRNSVDRVRR